MQQPPRAQSSIPVFTPRKSQGAPPATDSTPQLGFTSSSRHLSVSSSPTRSKFDSPLSTTGGLTPFRSFRSLFSSNTSKSAPPATHISAANSSKISLSGLGSLRRPTNGQRRGSGSDTNLQSTLSQDSPILEVELPRPGKESLFDDADFSTVAPERKSDTEAGSALSSNLSTDKVLPTLPVVPTELSVILEADSSRISQHIPTLDSSKIITEEDNLFYDKSTPPRAHSDNWSGPRTPRKSPHAESPVLDLSPNDVTNEVLQALGGRKHTKGWSTETILDDSAADNDALAAHGAAGDPDLSFNLKDLDPDLAAILNPNRTTSSTRAVGHSTPSPTRSEKHRPPLPTSAEIRASLPWQTTASESGPRPALSTPARYPASLSNSTSSNRPSAYAPLPLARSVSERPTYQRTAPPSPLSASHRLDSQSPEPRDREPPMSEYSRPFRRSFTGGTADTYRATASRTFTPARASARVSSYGSSSLASRQIDRSPTRASIDVPLRSSTSRPTSAASRLTTSSSLSNSRYGPARPSLDTDRLDTTFRPRTRERSSSVNEVTESRTPLPRFLASNLESRTARALAALDRERESMRRSVGGAMSTALTTRSSIDDRDVRARAVHSRSAFSESTSASTASWSRRSGSASRAGSAPRTVGSPRSEVLSVARTASSSTAVSSTSTAAAQLQAEMDTMRERHSVETGALLSALADSQRTTRVLRQENMELRDRIQELEERFEDAMEEIERMRRLPPPPPPPSQPEPQPERRAPRSRYARDESRSPVRPEGARARAQASFSPSSVGSPSSLELGNAAPSTPGGQTNDFLDVRSKRISTTSSLFPRPPANMKMLTNEDSLLVDFPAVSFSSRPGSPSSPTAMIAKLPVAQNDHKGADASAGDTSSTTTNCSFSSESPQSLRLRPEDLRHLEDMHSISLDLHAGDSDEDVEAFRL
ncbi:hypothetical protein WOLCODRAFT_164024 [Wolfiporia cocos MD-104 SS10]|uniref:Uncharacterized protein n=1 Tax=Wolfiporia cocos (strain MD-104) TaxID=742152 RepID=A0A2H3K1A2_WOLCO|nr:hypothetical protein WOLCODRAFT_164024 [Wolfiporia cocos MD-104 SS10]